MGKICLFALLVALGLLGASANAAVTPSCPKGMVYLPQFKACVPDYGEHWNYSQFADWCRNHPGDPVDP
jgi:hypothetical protein